MPPPPPPGGAVPKFSAEGSGAYGMGEDMWRLEDYERVRKGHVEKQAFNARIKAEEDASNSLYAGIQSGDMSAVKGRMLAGMGQYASAMGGGRSPIQSRQMAYGAMGQMGQQVNKAGEERGQELFASERTKLEQAARRQQHIQAWQEHMNRKVTTVDDTVAAMIARRRGDEDWKFNSTMQNVNAGMQAAGAAWGVMNKAGQAEEAKKGMGE
jgi:hypothetical protein